jgi:hypothetical protein
MQLTGTAFNQLGCFRKKILFNGEFVVENQQSLIVAKLSRADIKRAPENPSVSERCLVIELIKFN